MVDVVDDADLAKWMMNRTMRGIKTKKTKFVKGPKLNLKTFVLPSSSCLSSSIFILSTHLHRFLYP